MLEQHRNMLQAAVSAHRSGKVEAAQAIYSELHHIYPGNFDITHLLGLAKFQRGDAEGGGALVAEALAINPRSAPAHNNLGNIQKSLGLQQDAAASYSRALELKPDYPEALVNRGSVRLALGQAEPALADYQSALRLVPAYPDAQLGRGLALKQLRRFEEALQAFDAVLMARAGDADVLGNKASVLMELARPAAARDILQEAARRKPAAPHIHFNLANALLAAGQPAEALASFDTAIRLKPDYAEAHGNRGNLLAEAGRFGEAVQSYDEVIRLEPGNARALGNRGNALMELGRFGEAQASLDRALALDPDADYLLGLCLHVRMKLCSWAGTGPLRSQLESAIRAGRRAVFPWVSLGLYDDLAIHLAVAQSYAAGFPSAAGGQDSFPPPRPGGKIRIGYYSADFHNHATSWLMAELFEEHDRNAFELYGFSFGPRKADTMRQRVASAFTAFHEVNDMTDQQVVALSRQIGIDVAVDLKGYTKESRAGIFAQRCAPVQVNYLGHPGTMGAAFIDYIVADSVLIPEPHRPFYAEKIVYLPGSYQVNDSRRAIADRTFTRAELGLPEQGFVFCCFNNNYKITPETFDSWMRILRRVDGSVLWLLQDNDAAAANLRAEASQRGVDPRRLVFARRMPLEEHLARHRAAGLCLDTLPCNAHTTASDALWAGLPILTCIGNSFPARVAASLLTALDMPELITTTMQDYEDTAVALAQDPARLAALRQKLAEKRLTSSLFSGRRFARSIEAAYSVMHDRRGKGLGPEHIFVAPDEA